MANTIDVLVTTITDGIVTNVTARSKESSRNHIEACILNSSLKGVIRVMTVIVANVAWDAKIKVRA